MRKNIKLTIEYDGTAYHGWQRQKTDRSIQGEIETVLETMTGQRVRLIGSGRTDAGVHAMGQTANFICTTRMTPEAFLKGLNSLLPDDIVVKDCQEAPEGFHARFDAKRKTYQYRILNRPTPDAVCRQYAWHIHRPLDIGGMQQAISQVLGTHDFKAFEGSGSPRSNTVRTVMRADLTQVADRRLIIEMEADGFLKFMVRNIVGTLVYVGLRKFAPDGIRRILRSGDRRQAGITAPPHGLFLMRVDYEG